MPSQKQFCNVVALRTSLQSENYLTDCQFSTSFQVAQITESSTDLDNMSQLNPDAAEFVPVSPTCLALMNDQVIAQSPKKGNSNIDISVPNLQEFESEVKKRPSEVLFSNGHESESVSVFVTINGIVIFVTSEINIFGVINIKYYF